MQATGRHVILTTNFKRCHLIMNKTVYINTIFYHIMVNESYNSTEEKMKTENCPAIESVSITINLKYFILPLTRLNLAYIIRDRSHTNLKIKF